MSHSTLQIVGLREMLRKWRQLALKKAYSFSHASSPRVPHTRCPSSMPSGGDGHNSSSPRTVPAGHLAVYVGEERRRFVIKMWCLSHPLFRALLKKTEEEIGFQREGGLALPCEVAVFEQLLHIVHSCKARRGHHSDVFAADQQHEELLVQLLGAAELAGHALSTASQAPCNLSHSLSRSFNIPVVV